MPTSNKNDAQSFGKIALLASAAATAAYVITQTRLLQRLAEPAPSTRVMSPPPAPQQTEDTHDTKPIVDSNAGVSPIEASEAEQAEDSPADDDPEDLGPPPSPPAGRVRFRAARPARERLHYGLPVRHSRARPAAVMPESVSEPAAIAVMTPPASSPPAFDGEEFDADYLALVEAIARDGREFDDEVEDAVEEAPPTPIARTSAAVAVEEMTWLPAPRLQYIVIALAYVAISAVVGSDPVTLAIDGVRALATINSIDDLVLLGWILCGAIVVIPLGAIAARLTAVVARGKLHRPGVVSGETIDSAGWVVRLLAISTFIAGAVLYSPDALSWALNTDYPVAAVSSSSMSPSLDKGELVLIDGVSDIDQLHLGDIIAFTHEEGIAVRRVAGFTAGGVLAQADADPSADLVVPFENIAGRVLTLAGEQVKLPLLGNISHLGEPTVEPGEPPSSTLP